MNVSGSTAARTGQDRTGCERACLPALHQACVTRLQAVVWAAAWWALRLCPFVVFCGLEAFAVRCTDSYCCAGTPLFVTQHVVLPQHRMLCVRFVGFWTVLLVGVQ